MFTNLTYFKCLRIFSFSISLQVSDFFSCKKKNMVQLQIVLNQFRYLTVTVNSHFLWSAII